MLIKTITTTVTITKTTIKNDKAQVKIGFYRATEPASW